MSRKMGKVFDMASGMNAGKNPFLDGATLMFSRPPDENIIRVTRNLDGTLTRQADRQLREPNAEELERLKQAILNAPDGPMVPLPPGHDVHSLGGTITLKASQLCLQQIKKRNALLL